MVAMVVNRKTNNAKKKFVQVYLTEAEFEMLEQMALDAATSKTEFMRQLLLRDGDTFRNRANEAKSIQLAA